MYCLKCGFQLPDDSRFCNSCGAQVANASTGVVTTVQETRLENPYERDVTLLHLTDLRALEMVREKLRINIANVDNKINRLCRTNNPQKPCLQESDIPIIGFVGFFIASAVLLFLGWFIDELVTDVILTWVTKDKSSFFTSIGIVLAIISAVIGIIVFFVRVGQGASNRQKYQQEIAQYNQFIANDKTRIEREIIEKSQLSNVRNEMYDEWTKFDNSLKSAYNANIIPGQFRDIYAIYYLYEYLSTSMGTLSEALLHLDLDAIKQKLNTIIYQNQQIIIQNAIQIAQNEELKTQQDEVLQHAIQTEKNTAKAAQYAQISAAHAQAQTQIMVAQYITQNF